MYINCTPEIHGFTEEFEIEELGELLRGNSSGRFGKPSMLTAAVIFKQNPDPSDANVDLAYKIRLVTPKFITPDKAFSDINFPGPGKRMIIMHMYIILLKLHIIKYCFQNFHSRVRII